MIHYNMQGKGTYLWVKNYQGILVIDFRIFFFSFSNLCINFFKIVWNLMQEWEMGIIVGLSFVSNVNITGGSQFLISNFITNCTFSLIIQNGMFFSGILSNNMLYFFPNTFAMYFFELVNKFSLGLLSCHHGTGMNLRNPQYLFTFQNSCINIIHISFIYILILQSYHDKYTLNTFNNGHYGALSIVKRFHCKQEKFVQISSDLAEY
eukprot:TRINITY_DN5141_c0_g1_i4.p2 TRINITY_DN5141_c0_g1~~TRINITY_DN5141_c0_g1_i4.p2  ORF type:complete len:207 (+),score=-19.21 TRINITY_DN5141_c0_g1_i4:1273-1893(+)